MSVVPPLELALQQLPLQWQGYGPQLRADTQEALTAVWGTPPNGPEWQAEPFPRSAGDLAPLPTAAPRLLGITGLAQSGKDELAACAQAWFADVDRFAFSDSIFPEVNAFLNPRGYHVDHRCKVQAPFRRLLQAWGSGRRHEDPDYWVRVVRQEIERRLQSGAAMVVVTGLRVIQDPDTGAISLRDLEVVRDLGGEVWNVHRPGNPYNSGHDHHNERALSSLGPEDFEGWVWNSVEGDLEAYHANIRAALCGQPQPYLPPPSA